MTSVDIFLKLLAFIFVSCVTPGINNVLFFYYQLEYGVKKALIFRAGVVTAFPIIATTVVMSLSTVLSSFPILAVYFNYIGAALLLYIAYKIFKTNANLAKGNNKIKYLGYFASIGIQIFNAKTWSMSIIATSFFSKSNFDLFDRIYITFTAFFIGIILSSIPWLLAVHYFKKWLMIEKNIKIINYIFGSIVFYLAIKNII